MGLNEIAAQGFKQNRSVKYEKPMKSDEHKASYHYPSGNGSVSPIQNETESKKLIDQPGNTREYSYPSGNGDVKVSSIRRQNKYIVGDRTERGRDKIELSSEVVAGIKRKASETRIKDSAVTVTGEPRDFNRGYNSDKDMVGSIANGSKPQKTYERFIRPPQRLANQKISTSDNKETIDGMREYHYPSGTGFKSSIIGKTDVQAERGYRYPSGKGEKSPISGKVISGRSARRA